MLTLEQQLTAYEIIKNIAKLIATRGELFDADSKPAKVIEVWLRDVRETVTAGSSLPIQTASPKPLDHSHKTP